MNKYYTLLFLLVTTLFFAQTEQISLNFFGEKILPKIKKAKVFYDGKVIDKAQYEETKSNSDEETVIENILWDYKLLENDRRGLSNKDVHFYKTLNFGKIEKFANVRNSHLKVLTLPKSIILVDKLKIKKRKSGKFILSTTKYNLRITPSIQLTDDIYLTRIFLTKQDFEKGSFFDIIVQNNKIVDWTETGWIQ